MSEIYMKYSSILFYLMLDLSWQTIFLGLLVLLVMKMIKKILYLELFTRLLIKSGKLK